MVRFHSQYKVEKPRVANKTKKVLKTYKRTNHITNIKNNTYFSDVSRCRPLYRPESGDCQLCGGWRAPGLEDTRYPDRHSLAQSGPDQALASGRPHLLSSGVGSGLLREWRHQLCDSPHRGEGGVWKTFSAQDRGRDRLSTQQGVWAVPWAWNNRFLEYSILCW